jgi:hypothetical protein
LILWHDAEPGGEPERIKQTLLSKSFSDINIGDETTTIGRTITEADVIGVRSTDESASRLPPGAVRWWSNAKLI